MTLLGMVLSLGVLAGFLILFVPIARLLNRNRDETIDGSRMRHVYVALSLYELDHDNLPAPNLLAIKLDVEPTDFQSVSDPAVGSAGPFPLDPALSNSKPIAPLRISWSYRWHWPNAGSPREVRLDPRCGLLSSWWQGEILRVNTQGALVHAPRNGGGELTFPELFGR